MYQETDIDAVKAAEILSVLTGERVEPEWLDVFWINWARDAVGRLASSNLALVLEAARGAAEEGG